MKKIAIVTMGLAVAITSCQDFKGYFKNESTTAADSTAMQQTVVERDVSITAANAYNDLFLDSTAVENYISSQKLSDTVARDLRNFYNKRNFQYTWLGTNGVTEQGRGFWNLYDQYKKENSNNSKEINSLKQRMDSLVANDSLVINRTDSTYTQTELALTQAFIQSTKNNADSNLSYAQLVNYLPVKKMTAMQWADTLLKQKDTSFYSRNTTYAKLASQLRKYYDAAQKGGWQPIKASTVKLKKGTSLPPVAAIKKRLQATGEYTTTDTTAIYTDSLEAAIMAYQQRNGFKPTGVVTDSLIAVMNIPVEKRIEQILINMNRSIWMPVSLQQNSKTIAVNIPQFVLTAYDGNNKAFDMDVVVGKEGTNTMMFTGDLNQVVFNPSWNIPKSIVQKEILPAMKSDPAYLKKHNMEIVKQNDSIPEIKQLPGKDNSLGKVKFLFPNSYDIYFHDTPAKGLFEKDNRALSHGCIRLADAEKMANYLLSNDGGWPAEKVKEAMNSGKEQTVKLNKTVPVYITYYTAWVDENGLMNFRGDIYKHDENTARMMFSGV